MDVSTVSQATATTTATGGNPDQVSVLTSDFDTFLRMLTTQAQNQDPFNPVDATEYASQLASFSAVEQQVLTNKLLTGLVERVTGEGFERMASWIGLETLAPGAAYLDGAGVALTFDPVEEDESAVLVLRDATGALRNRISLAAGQKSYVWDGTDLSGSQLPAGVYGAALELSREGVVVETRDARSYMRIDEVRRDGASYLLTLQGGGHMDVSEVAALRRPEV
ncbi:flagellar hook capping FlgD N-terminal domain-containing protein [Alloyangia pacifica]|uniref:Basal-body rod modification protein FlgD n=1 Tax=Alloyangia pacifica TaxID=311180 RepID=A0A1I6TZZ4_9RHOB|nr:flagellar hook capping FlgD N-terminal domain-containing protein [Alloyangia pacifica]SDH31487.1 flagellar basal-body rod modification protein FlgD [Alloyangia pacifica]SFS94762.1 flagellar basal-body rod modification protein FlgD [Alloyangia pacifica]